MKYMVFEDGLYSHIRISHDEFDSCSFCNTRHSFLEAKKCLIKQLDYHRQEYRDAIKNVRTLKKDEVRY